MSTVSRSELGIRSARSGEARAVAEVIARAFDPIDLTRWLVPDVFDRIPTMTRFLCLSVEHAITWGTVDVVENLGGVAVWLPSDAPDIDDYDRRLAEATDRWLPRFQALDAAMHANHPSDRLHEYLPFIAVEPHAQARRLGTALLERHHAQLDQRRVPAYLEAAGQDSARLYRRHGYQNINQPFGPAGSTARLRPMWREPRTRQ